ncbi:MAG: D-alanyl-D-alanine carboxypeptidase family protein [Patescibacteria group bacterium]
MTRQRVKKILLAGIIGTIALFSWFTVSYGADTWLYWYDTPAQEIGSYDTKAKCEQALASVDQSWPKSPACYKALPVKITGFSPASGTIGDMITINGENLIGIVQITIGGVEAWEYGNNDGGRSVRAKIQAGTTGGKIAVATEYRGTATSTGTLALTGDTAVKWWFNNAQSQQQGPYDTEAQCKAAAAKFASSYGLTNVPPCSAKTKAQSDADSHPDEAVPLEPKTETPVNNDYNLLAPIGNFTSVNDTGTCPIDASLPNGVGCYLNTIFTIAIGLCAALAVIMIIISSVQYMGDESVFGKTEAKGKILSAILGLLIALGAYAILNTISPELTGSNGVSISQVNLEIDGEPMIADDPVPSTGSSTVRCPEGVQTINTATKPFTACIPLTSKIQKMVSDAYNSTPSIVITGYGFRSKQRQAELRVKNGCPDVDKSPASSCRIPTAIPGTSMHESGLAFDLQCDGQSIRSRDNKCFLWLQKNAQKSEYGGLKNLSSEPWHWSTTGH